MQLHIQTGLANSICAGGSMERLLGFKAKTELENGLRTTIDWHREHLIEFAEIYVPKEDDFWQEWLVAYQERFCATLPLLLTARVEPEL